MLEKAHGPNLTVGWGLPFIYNGVVKTGLGKRLLICLLLVASGYLFVGLNTTVPFWPWDRTHDSLLLAYSLGFLSAALTLASWQNKPESSAVPPKRLTNPVPASSILNPRLRA